MGPGSFLVRKSERSPGNFSLFFHINNTVQRFRIEKVADRYIMAGRTFDSLDAVIQRYQREQIVEGYCLGDPVLKPPMQVTGNRSSRNGSSSSPPTFNASSGNSLTFNTPSHLTDTCNQDVYATLRESKEQAKKQNSGLMKGYLYMKSLKSMKWKYFYFALNTKDQQLCFYENEKRVKPKGLLDLSYTYLYPVHDSLFERAFCFQLVERTIPCISTYYYLAADSAETSLVRKMLLLLTFFSYIYFYVFSRQSLSFHFILCLSFTFFLDTSTSLHPVSLDKFAGRIIF